MHKKTATVIRATLREALVIIALTVCTAFVVNMMRSDGLDIFGKPAPARQPSESPQSGSSSEVMSIGIDEAIGVHTQQSALFLDARPAEDYARGHIPGAVSFPDYRFDEKIGPFLESTPPEMTLVTYCEGESCHLSLSLAEKLYLAGYENVYHMIDGLGQWKMRDMPLETGE
jgi:rhodanese-related sulfurtransferase